MANVSKIIKLKCPKCNALAVEVSRSEVGDLVFIKLACNHTFVEEKVKSVGYNLESADGRTLMPFQVEGVKFIEESQGRTLVADEMGLGKTVQALAFLKLHPDMLPALIIVKSSLKMQWFAEVIRWCGKEYLPQVIGDSKTPFLPGAPVYIVSYDILRRIKPEVKAALSVKTVVIDECQQIKNHASTRAKEVQDICKGVQNVIALSGTPIKNNAGEYFTILNLLQPRKFPSYAGYIRFYCDAYDSGWGTKVGGLKNPEIFHDMTKDFIIRRTRSEVLPDLPAINRTFSHVALDDKYKNAYKKAQEEFEEDYYNGQDDGSADFATSAIAKLSRLRQIVGYNKVEPTVERVIDIMLDTNEKVVIGTHHIEVTNLLISTLRRRLIEEKLAVRVLELRAGDDKQAVVADFQNPECRVLVASTLAAGEGTDGLQKHCHHVIMMERQWNPANEQQFEDRIARIGQEANKLTAEYMIASGTIDEMFTELVEQKRALVSATMDNKEIAWDQSSLMKDLMERVAMSGGKRWKLS